MEAERVGLKEVLAALDEFAKDQHEYGRRLSELVEATTVRSVDAGLTSLQALSNDTLARLAGLDREYAEIKELVIRVFNL
ncbi:MAG TPA: hypothetical protein VIW24_07975 [Aldersonia sp.]